MKRFSYLKNKKNLKRNQNRKNKQIFHKSQKLQNSNKTYLIYKRNSTNYKNGKRLYNKTSTKTS